MNDENLERMLWIWQSHLEIFHSFALLREELISRFLDDLGSCKKSDMPTVTREYKKVRFFVA
jgi:hypothetical protein